MSKEDAEAEAFVVIPCDSLEHAIASLRVLKSEGWGATTVLQSRAVFALRTYLEECFRRGEVP